VDRLEPEFGNEPLEARPSMPIERNPAVSGLFYPEAPEALRADVRSRLEEADKRAGVRSEREHANADRAAPKALIVPHAGYVYSGSIAASAYRQLGPAADIVRRVVLFGPSHRVRVRGLALPAAQSFVTPLGTVPVDADAVAAALALPQVVQSDAAHALEHSLEVQLPFLQTVLSRFGIVPFAVGEATAGEVAQVIELLYGGPETLIVISSDLSHFHPYSEACRIDEASMQAVLSLTATLGYEQACGAPAINGLLLAARRHGLQPKLLDLRNSGDTAGDRLRVVGYAAFSFAEASHGRH